MHTHEIHMKYMWYTPGKSLVVFSYSNLEKCPLPQKRYSKTFSRSFLAPKLKELSNIKVNRNCQPIGVPQNTIPDVQELILLLYLV